MPSVAAVAVLLREELQRQLAGRGRCGRYGSCCRGGDGQMSRAVRNIGGVTCSLHTSPLVLAR